MKQQIKIGFCVAYDWYFLRISLPLIYKDADLICLSLDKDRISWTGSAFDFDEQGFREMVREIDTEGKIKLLEEDFHQPDLTPMQNEVRQRNRIAAFMGKDDGWHIQLDTDEFFLDFTGFVHYLKQLKIKRPVNICCPWITLFKQTDKGFLWIKNEGIDQQDMMAIATNVPHYEFGRRNSYFNHLTSFALLHQSWARSEEEIAQKINNWGHKTDFDVAQYFQFWKNVSSENYRSIHNFHPIDTNAWQELGFLEAKDLNDLVARPGTHDLIRLPLAELKKRNSLWRSRYNKLKRILKRKS